MCLRCPGTFHLDPSQILLLIGDTCVNTTPCVQTLCGLEIYSNIQSCIDFRIMLVNFILVMENIFPLTNLSQFLEIEDDFTIKNRGACHEVNDRMS